MWPTPSTDSTFSTLKQDAFSGGAFVQNFTTQWNLNLFRVLDFPRPPAGGGLVLTPLYQGMGPNDPWIAFPANVTPDRTQRPEAILSRLACHWFVTQLSDADVLDLLTLCLERWRALHPPISIEFSPPALTGDNRFAVTAVIPRSANPDDDLVVYKEKADPKTVQWIQGLTKRK